MRELFFKLFEMSHFDTGISVTAFSIPHFIYMFLIGGGIIGGYFLLKNKPAQAQEKGLRAIAYAIVFSYLSDFFVHDFVYGGMNMDKLPFHVCTILCPLIAFAQFNRNGKKLAEPVTMLAIVAPLMYLCYPASIGTGEPWCYQAVQTMFFHGCLLAWGVLNLALGIVKPAIQNSSKAALLLGGITLWAKLGNVLLQHNWFFLQEDALYIGLVAGGVIPQWALMIINPLCFFAAVLLLYGVYALCTRRAVKAKAHKPVAACCAQ